MFYYFIQRQIYSLRKEPFNNILLVNIMSTNSIKFLVLVFVQHNIMCKDLHVIKLN